MRNLHKVLSVVFLLFFIFTAPSNADIKSVKIRSDGRRLILFHEFECTQTGQVSVAITSVSITAMPVTSNLSRPDPSRFGFFLVSDDAIINYMNYEHISCDLDSKFISLLFTFQDLSPHSQASFNKSNTVTYPNMYSIRFANCNPLSYVTMDVRTEFYNTHNGTTKDYLSPGQTKLPSLYFNLYLIYLCSLAFWISVCFKNHPSCQWIHLLMGFVTSYEGAKPVICNQGPTFSKGYRYSSSCVGGLALHISVYQECAFLRCDRAIIDGCSFLKLLIPVKLGLIIVIPLRVLATIASKMVGEESMVWDVGLVLADFIYKILFILLIGLAVNSTSETDKSVKNYSAKLTLMWLFYIVFILHSCVDYVCGAFGSDAAETAEIATLVLYMVMFILFRPSEKNEYSFPLYLPVPGALVGDVELGCGV